MGKFAFIVHPPEASGMARMYTLARYLPRRLVEGMLSLAPPVKVSLVPEIRSPHGWALGWMVSVPMTAGQMVKLSERSFKRRLLQAGRLAERLGAGIVGLGTVSSAAISAGCTLERGLNIAVTTGNSYTVAIALEACKKAALLMGRDFRSVRAVVIGAADPVGSVCSLMLARGVKRMTLVDGEKRKLEEVAGKIFFDSGLSVITSQDPKRDLRSADVVVVAAGPGQRDISPEDLAPGAVVCNLAGARNLAGQLAQMRNDILVLEGGVVEVPGGPSFQFDPALPPGTAGPAAAETMILAMEESYKNFLPGRPVTVRQLEVITALARKHGFKLAGLKGLNGLLTPAEVERIRAGVARKDKGCAVAVNT